MRKKEFIRGLKNGIPVGLGYLAVSFTFGIMAITFGLDIWQATIISMLTLTSAGQVAGVGIMPIPGMYIDMLVTQLTINIRYAFMGIALSQKVDSKFKGIFKWFLSFFITDEIFAVSINEEKISRTYFLGVAVTPYFGWTLGTFLGSFLGSVLPDVIMNALCIAIYGMFIATIAPASKKDYKTLIVVLITILFSSLFYYLPYLNKISSGLAISICAVLAAIIGSIFFPRKEIVQNGK